MPNALLAFAKPEEVKACCQQLIETLGAGGGYIMDAAAIMQNDAAPENLRAMTDATLEYGVYRSASSPSGKLPPAPAAPSPGSPDWLSAPRVPPGVCLPFEEKLPELPPISGDPALVRRVWEEIDGLAYLYIWHVLLSY